MKITRKQFLKLIPAAALTLTGCGSKTQPANTESIQEKLLVNTINQQFDFHTSFGSLIQCCKKICSAFICPQIKGCQYNTLLRRSNHPQTPQKCLFIIINTADPFAP